MQAKRDMNVSPGCMTDLFTLVDTLWNAKVSEDSIIFSQMKDADGGCGGGMF